jgi:hypothetical protein
MRSAFLARQYGLGRVPVRHRRFLHQRGLGDLEGEKNAQALIKKALCYMMYPEGNNMYKYVLNNIIPADDLHWCEEESKYVSLSREEVDEIIATCMNNQITELDDIYKVINWCGNIRVGQILWKNFISGGVNINGFDDQGEPKFSPRKD